jgi:hypothetical protein
MSYEFKFDESQVEKELFDDGIGAQYPAIVWHGKYTEAGDSGYWTLDRSESEDPPGPQWEPAEVSFGTGPNATPAEVWRAEKIRVCVLGVRKRIVISAEDGSLHTYPWLTPKSERRAGKYKAHYQIAVTLPDTDDRIFILALRGLTKTVSWSNPPGGRYHRGDFPIGAEVTLRAYAREASKEIGSTIPPYCSFWLDLVAHTDSKGKPEYVDVGYGTHALPFTADLSVNGDLPHRFVGMPLFLRYQELRKNEIAQWEKAWSKKRSSEPEDIDPYEELPETEAEADGVAF